MNFNRSRSSLEVYACLTCITLLLMQVTLPWLRNKLYTISNSLESQDCQVLTVIENGRNFIAVSNHCYMRARARIWLLMIRLSKAVPKINTTTTTSKRLLWNARKSTIGNYYILVHFSLTLTLSNTLRKTWKLYPHYSDDVGDNRVTYYTARLLSSGWHYRHCRV